MTLSIIFNDPLYISNGDTPDKLEMEVLDNTYFEAKETGKFIAKKTKFKASL